MTKSDLPGIPKAVQFIRGRNHIASELGRALRSPAVAIGNFDGVHLGHRVLLQEARRIASACGGDTVALTFDPHPARFFAPSLAPPMLASLARRAELLGEAGADIVLAEPFTAEFARLSAEEFVEQVLATDLGARHVVVGADFSFGKDRRGNAALLARMTEKLGIGLSIIPQVAANGLVCSSTKVREFILAGRVEGAQLLLGRPFEIDGLVVHGLERGRKLGVPTINLAYEGEILPKPGVYAGRARRLDGNQAAHAAAISIGTNPTFTKPGDPELFIEAHLLDFIGDLYDARMRIQFLTHLREQRRFASVDELIVAMQADIARTREICL